MHVNYEKCNNIIYPNLICTFSWHSTRIDYFLNKIRSEDSNKGWIDFESEISHVVQSLDCVMRYNTEVNRIDGEAKKENKELYNDGQKFFNNTVNKGIDLGYQVPNWDIKTFYGDRAKRLIDELVDDLNKLIRCLEIYLEEVVEEISIDYKLKDIEDICNEIDKVLSFNYTNTFKRIYEQSSTDIEYDYIHGKLNVNNKNKENNMVLGIDEYLDDMKRNKELEFIEFKKYFQRIYKKTGCMYKRWVEEMKLEYEEYFNAKKAVGDIEYLEDKDLINEKTMRILEDKGGKHNIYIFGHSLDVTDKEILKDLILLENATITIFYHDNLAYMQQISNLVKIIGQDILIDKVYGNAPKIIFKKQNKNI